MLSHYKTSRLTLDFHGMSIQSLALINPISAFGCPTAAAGGSSLPCADSQDLLMPSLCLSLQDTDRACKLVFSL